jgi:hypothetical protein
MYERVQGNDVYNTAGNVPFSASVAFPNVSLESQDKPADGYNGSGIHPLVTLLA